VSEPRVVILGGGFGGLTLGRALRRVAVQVTLIDRTNHHVFQPLLYQVATAALSAPDISYPIRSVLRKQPRTEVLLGEATRIDLNAHEVGLADGDRIRYDYLVLAPGARHSYFRHPEWERPAPGLKTLEDAGEIRRRILLAFERAERHPDHLTFVVVGGGPTGVELVGAIAEVSRYTLRRDFRHVDPKKARILLLEGGPRILPSYPPALSDRAERHLTRLGVEVRTGMLVSDVQPDGVRAGDQVIPASAVIWAAGNRASPLLRELGAPLDTQGRVIVEQDCSVPGHPEVFVLGDAAVYTHQPGYGTLPGTSPVAMQMGRYVARAIQGDLSGRQRMPFRYFNKGQLAVIGRGFAIADFGWLRVSGFPAWLLWVFVHIFYLIGFRSRVLVMFEWAWSYITLSRGARVITGEWKPGEGTGDRGPVTGDQ
jgi:NADH dehydrogenase